MTIAQKDSIEALRHTSAALIDELKTSAAEVVRLIEQLEKQQGRPHEELDELEVKLQVAATSLRLDAQSVEAILEEITDAMPDDEEVLK